MARESWLRESGLTFCLIPTPFENTTLLWSIVTIISEWSQIRSSFDSGIIVIERRFLAMVWWLVMEELMGVLFMFLVKISQFLVVVYRKLMLPKFARFLHSPGCNPLNLFLLDHGWSNESWCSSDWSQRFWWGKDSGRCCFAGWLRRSFPSNMYLSFLPIINSM